MPKALQNVPQTPRVYTRGTEVFANSIDVAAYFDKGHNNVVQAIERRIESNPECAPHFQQTFKSVDMPKGGTRQIRCYEMDRDGFILCGMGFTTAKAVSFKLRYIAEFNRMEAELRERATAPRTGLVDLNDLASVQVALLSLVQDKQHLLTVVSETKGQLAVAAPKAAAWDAYGDKDGQIALTDLGRILDYPPVKLLAWLVEKKVLFRQTAKGPLRPYEVYRRRGWFIVRTFDVNGVERLQTLVTPRGIHEVAAMLGRPLDMLGQVDRQARLPLLAH